VTLTRVQIPSPNYSSRGGTPITHLVLHTAEGALTYQSLGAYFQNPSAQVSSHVGIDDTPNTVGEYVPRVPGKAWTAANANPYSVQAELCAFASWNSATWNSHPTMLANTAAWLAEEAAALNIPLVLLSAAQAQDPNARGVCQHNDLGASGGGHWDCGPSFPIDHVIDLAKGGATPPPAEEEEPDMIMIQRTSTGGTAMYDGAVKRAVADGTSATAYRNAGIKVAVLSAAEFDSIPWVTQILTSK
jgi:hypothetical protein